MEPTVLPLVIFSLYGGFALLEQVRPLRFKPSPFLRPFFATDVVWFLLAIGDGAGNTLDSPSSIAVDSAGHDPDRALAGDHLKYQDMGTGPAVLSIKATRELPGKTLDTGHRQACHHLPEVVRAIEDGRLHLGRVTSRIGPWENAIEALVIPVPGEELISRRVDSAPEGRG